MPTSRFRSGVLYLRLVRPLVHMGLIAMLFWLVYLLRLRTDLIPGVQLRIPPIITSELMLFACISMVVFLFWGWRYGLYTLRGTPRYRKLFVQTRISWAITIVFVAYIGSGFVFSGGISRFIVLVAAVAALLFLSLFDLLRNAWIHHLRQSDPFRVLCIYQTDSQQDKVSDALGGQGYRMTRLPAGQRNGREDYEAYDMVLAVGDYQDEQLEIAFDQIRLAHQEFYHIPSSGLLDDVVYQPVMLGSMHTFRCMPSTLDDRSRVFKRVFDVVGSIVGIVLLSPVMLIVAIAIRLDSPGPVVYRQQRVGKRGDHFTFLKFRSMYTHLSTGADYGGDQAAKIESDLDASDANSRDDILTKIENDPRVTRVGRVIRRTSLDELPQLFCVLRGTMSLVGPRPHLPREVAKYENWHTRLFAIKPGITGYAQIFGRDALTFDEEAKLDLNYIQNRSLWMDIYAIIRTVGVVFKGR